MSARSVKRIAVFAALASLAAVQAAVAVDAVVVDSKGKSIQLTNVRSTTLRYAGSRQHADFLPVATRYWTLEIHFSLIKKLEAQPDSSPAGKRRASYSPLPVKVTLTTGKTVEGTIARGLTGKSDFGDATIQHGDIKTITFTQTKADKAYKPSSGGMTASIDDQGDGKYSLTNVEFFINGTTPATEISGKRGDVTLSISVERIAKIEMKGTRKERFQTLTTWHVTLDSGKSTDLDLTSSYSLEGEFTSGRASVAAANLKTVSLAKKK